MFGLLALGAFLLFGVMLLGLIGGILKLVFWLVFLPLRLLGKLIALPFMAIGFFFKLLFGVMLLPLLLVGGLDRAGRSGASRRWSACWCR